MSFKEGLSYDDVLLVPQYSNITTRREVDLSVNIIKILNDKTSSSTTFAHPIIPANMKNVTGEEMALAVWRSGGLAIVHRFMTIDEQVEIVNNIKMKPNALNSVGFSVGVKPSDWKDIEALVHAGAKILCIDIAHGDSSHSIDMIKKIKSTFDVLLIAGNVATGQAAKRLWDSGADMVKVGIGGGCFAEGTRVLMSNGAYKNIEDILPGDRVINKDGNPVDVLDAFCTGVRKVSSLTNNGFYKNTLVTLDHRFLLNDNDNDTVDWFPISNLLEDNNLKTLSPGFINFEVPQTFKMTFSNHNKLKDDYETYNDKNPLVSINVTPNYDVGYLVGTFLLDGVLRQNSVSFEFSNMDTLEASEVADRLLSALDGVLGRNAFTYDIALQDDTIRMIVYNDLLLDILSRLENENGDKVLPKEFLVYHNAYLQGIHDSYYESRFMTISGQPDTKSQLLNEVFYFVNQCLLGSLNNSFHNKELSNQFNALSNVKLDKLDLDVLTYDITVNCQTHSFIANNMIVHNSLCTTRLETGNGVPQLTAIMDVHEMRKSSGYTEKGIIADGGIKNSGDVVKALCFSDMVMVGNIFAGCDETPGELFLDDETGEYYKEYNGSSTHKTDHIEGVKSIVKAKGSFSSVLDKLLQGVKSGCSYQGVRVVSELQDSPEFVRMTAAGMRESGPHDVKIVKE